MEGEHLGRGASSRMTAHRHADGGCVPPGREACGWVLTTKDGLEVSKVGNAESELKNCRKQPKLSREKSCGSLNKVHGCKSVSTAVAEMLCLSSLWVAS